ncbi:MAG TPA: hypothetical protein DEG26_09635 [Chloroflexi bacterium]|nr:hypothetical protein [Chloroflexota bacterium]
MPLASNTATVSSGRSVITLVEPVSSDANAVWGLVAASAVAISGSAATFWAAKRAWGAATCWTSSR